MPEVSEATLKADFCKEARIQLYSCVVLRHEDRFTHGIPDTSITGRGKTFWLEAKYANPDFESKGIQELTMSRLALAGLARYVVYAEEPAGRRTYIIQPRFIGRKEIWSFFTRGFDHQFVIDVIKEAMA